MLYTSSKDFASINYLIKILRIYKSEIVEVHQEFESRKNKTFLKKISTFYLLKLVHENIDKMVEINPRKISEQKIKNCH